MNNAVFLRIYEGETQLDVRQFDEEQIVIGRNAKVNIDLADSAVSPIHAMIEKRGQSFYLCDLGSETGTFKNSEKIIDVLIDSGDLITIGPYSINFYIGEPKPREVPPSLPKESSNLGEEVTDIVEPQDSKGVDVEAPEIVERNISFEGVAAQKKTGNTFAPQSLHKSVSEILGPSKGPVVEVMIAWKERIIDTYHFSERKQIVLGGHEQCDIYLPVFGNKNIQHTLLDIGMQTTVLLSPNMTGDVSSDGQTKSYPDLVKSGRLSRNSDGYAMTLTQGELVRAELPGETVTLYIRFVANSPKPFLAPMLDLKLPEIVSLATSVFMSVFLSLYVSIKVPKDSAQQLIELAKPRRATIIYNNPVEPPVEEKVEKIKKIEQLPPLTVAKKVEKEAPKVVKIKKSIKTVQKKKKKKVGKSTRIRPKNLPKAPKKVTSIKPKKTPGQRKLSPKSGQSAATKKKDISKVGILGVLGSSGTMKKIDKEATGIGVLQGLANEATGGVGEDSNKLGEVGTKILDVGRGGDGVATIGIDNVGTKGRGSGQTGYGTAGLGTKKNIEVKLGDAEDDFLGKIDREAIRRVIQRHIRQIKACYDRVLNRQPNLQGKLVLQWVIGEAGIVASAKERKDKSDLNSAQVTQCIIRNLKTWRFPEPPAGVQAEVSYPFVFRSVK